MSIVIPVQPMDTEPRGQRNDERRVWYLVLLLGFPCPTYPGPGDAEGHLRVVGRECKPLGVKIRRLLVHLRQHRDSNGRYLFRFLRYKRDDQAAVRLAESFLYGLSLVHGPMIEPDHDSLVLRVPDAVIRHREEVSVDELINLEKSRGVEDRMLDFPNLTLGAFSTTSADQFEAAWRIARVTFADQHLFEATRFLKRSYDNFYVYPGQITEVAYDPDLVPKTSSHQTHFEDALQNAFKAVEATIGDPPKDDRRLFEKLRQIGIDPEEQVGYGTKMAFHQVIRHMNSARDKKAAHGSTKNRVIKAADLLNYQECSACVVTAALEAARGASLFSS